jgi:hypothetical protein
MVRAYHHGPNLVKCAINRNKALMHPYKSIRFVALIGLLAISLPAEETDAKLLTNTEEVKRFVDTAEAKPTRTDEFMDFMLGKAKTYTEKGEAALSKTVDFALKEAEPTVKEFLVWRFWQHTIYFLIPMSIAVIALITSIWNGKKSATINQAYRTDAREVVCFISAVVALVAILFTGACVHHLMSALQIHLAPRVYLIEELGKLIK